jgi:hypothetical protein
MILSYKNNPIVIYIYSIVITTVILFYNKNWFYFGMLVHYQSKNFITFDPVDNVIKLKFTIIPL